MTDILGILEQLEDARLDYVVERAKVTTDKAAYEAAGISKSTFYTWTGEEREELNQLAQKLKRENATKAMMILQQGVERAAEVLVEQLELKRNPSVQQRAAVEVLDRSMGKPSQKVEQEITQHVINVDLVGDDD